MEKCRAIKDGNVVFFNSIGKTAEGNAVKYSESGTSYSEKQQALADSLTQRLSILKGELWYYNNYGIPLLDKIRTKLEVDIEVANIIEDHENVKEIQSFQSEIIEHRYNCQIVVLSDYGQITIQI